MLFMCVFVAMLKIMMAWCDDNDDMMTGSFADDWPYGIFYFERIFSVGTCYACQFIVWTLLSPTTNEIQTAWWAFDSRRRWRFTWQIQTALTSAGSNILIVWRLSVQSIKVGTYLHPLQLEMVVTGPHCVRQNTGF